MKKLTADKIPGSVDCYCVCNLLSSHLLFENIKIKIYRTIILPGLLYGCETWSDTLREEHSVRLSEEG
jgi:hypothetical protein